MAVVPSLRTWLSVAALPVFCLASAAAPAPEAKAVNEKYLPDDADAVLVVNVKEVAASPLYTRHFQKKLQDLLLGEAAPKWLKDLREALPRDVDRVTLALGRSNFGGPDGRSVSGPTVVVEGRPAVLWDTLKQLAKDLPMVVKEQKVGDVTVYEVATASGGPGGFVARADERTLVLVPRKELMAEVLDKAAGKKTTRLKSQVLRDLLAAMKPDLALQFAATKDMVIGGSVTVTTVMGKELREEKYVTLADQGIDSMQGSFRAGEELKGRVTLTIKDEETAKGMAQDATAGLDRMRASLKQALETEKEKKVLTALMAVRESLKTVKIGSRGREITLEGQASAETLEGLPLLFFTVRTSDPPPVPVPVKP
jgi:hypothetical protein